MMFPSVFGENLFDDWMDDFGFRDNFFSGKNPLYGKHAKNIMKTDVRETDKGYEPVSYTHLTLPTILLV